MPVFWLFLRPSPVARPLTFPALALGLALAKDCGPAPHSRGARSPRDPRAHLRLPASQVWSVVVSETVSSSQPAQKLTAKVSESLSPEWAGHGLPWSSRGRRRVTQELLFGYRVSKGPLTEIEKFEEIERRFGSWLRESSLACCCC